MLEELLACRRPFLIGVRHCSPACAVRIADWLDSFEPQLILLELPTEMAPWMDWLSHPDTMAPVALAASGTGDSLSFYPFADFSPELAAARWARRHGVEIRPFDKPAGVKASRHKHLRFDEGELDVLDALAGGDFESFWDRLVEAPAPGATAEALRGAALLTGWIQRLQEAADPGIRERDLVREAHMRGEIERALGERERVAAVVGSFHAAALLPEPRLWRDPGPTEAPQPVETSLVPYSFDLLDSRSGYPAGIRDPVWQQSIFACALDPDAIKDSVGQLLVEICRELRSAGHPSGSPDATEGMRMALELAHLRGLPAPGRRELLESIESTMAQGELLGRGRALARALQSTLVGSRRGHLAPGTPRSGLAPHVHALLEKLALPTGPTLDKGLWRLDPLRSPTDRSRHVTLMRLRSCGIQYATLRDSVEALTAVWTIEWGPATDATLEIAGLRGVTLTQASAGAIIAGERGLLDKLSLAAECALGELVDRCLEELGGPFLESAGLTEVLAAVALVDRIARHHVPGLPEERSGVEIAPIPAFRLDFPREVLVAAAVKAVDGLAGSDQLSDVYSLQELVGLCPLGLRLKDSLCRLAEEGSPTMQGAGTLALLSLGELSTEVVKPRLASWIDGAPGREMADRLRGALAMAAPRLEGDLELIDGLHGALAGQSDDAFLERVASLREGFEVLSPAARARFLESLGIDARLILPPEWMAELARADLAGVRAVQELGLPMPVDQPGAETSRTLPACSGQIALVDRWRLILAQGTNGLSGRASRVARALDELYGRGHGEGSSVDVAGTRAGDEKPFPGAREWALELDELFGAAVRQEVLGKAAEGGRAAALLEIDPDSVVPSIELLEVALSLKGALPEAALEKLRRLVDKVIRALVAELARRLRPALSGLATPRATRRSNGRLDLGRTVRANLQHARREGEAWRIVAEKLVFRSRARRSLDWRVVLVVDVSGSMEESVIYSAMMAAILAGLPALSVHFVAFSTEVIDFSERVSDPLSLLMEVTVGGGTLIAPALRYARKLMTVPSRSLVVLVSDFEDGSPLPELLGEVRALVESGARPLGLAALSDEGKPRYCVATAEAVAGCGMPVAALTPLELARWVGEQIR